MIMVEYLSCPNERRFMSRGFTAQSDCSKWKLFEKTPRKDNNCQIGQMVSEFQNLSRSDLLRLVIRRTLGSIQWAAFFQLSKVCS